MDKVQFSTHSITISPFNNYMMNNKYICLQLFLKSWKVIFLKFKIINSEVNLVPRVSPLHVPRSERGETLVGSGHVSPREKLHPGRGPSLAIFCQDLLSTPKQDFRFAMRSPRETHSTHSLLSRSLGCEEERPWERGCSEVNT